jgi:hypothetical protein
MTTTAKRATSPLATGWLTFLLLLAFAWLWCFGLSRRPVKRAPAPPPPHPATLAGGVAAVPPLR